MPNFVLLKDETCERVGAVGVSNVSQLYPAPDGCTWHEIEGDIATRTLARLNGALVEVDLLVDPARQLAKARADRWAAAKAYRDARQVGGCTTQWGRVQTDDASQGRIGNAALGASIRKAAGQPFSINWTMADNTVAILDADGTIGLGFAVLSFVAACQDAGTAIRASIDAATTPDAVAAVDVAAGYPPA